MFVKPGKIHAKDSLVYKFSMDVNFMNQVQECLQVFILISGSILKFHESAIFSKICEMYCTSLENLYVYGKRC